MTRTLGLPARETKTKKIETTNQRTTWLLLILAFLVTTKKPVCEWTHILTRSDWRLIWPSPTTTVGITSDFIAYRPSGLTGSDPVPPALPLSLVSLCVCYCGVPGGGSVETMQTGCKKLLAGEVRPQQHETRGVWTYHGSAAAVEGTPTLMDHGTHSSCCRQDGWRCRGNLMRRTALPVINIAEWCRGVAATVLRLCFWNCVSSYILQFFPSLGNILNVGTCCCCAACRTYMPDLHRNCLCFGELPYKHRIRLLTRNYAYAYRGRSTYIPARIAARIHGTQLCKICFCLYSCVCMYLVIVVACFVDRGHGVLRNYVIPYR